MANLISMQVFSSLRGGFMFSATILMHTESNTHTHTYTHMAYKDADTQWTERAAHTFGHNECAATFLMVPTDNNKLLLALNESH